jgi:hypothetical protein
MKDFAKELRERVKARGPNGECLSLLIGDEPLADLRVMVMEMSQLCPAGKNHEYCPFRVLSGLSYATLTKLIENMPRESCLNLFELELNCRAQAEGACRLDKNLPPPEP